LSPDVVSDNCSSVTSLERWAQLSAQMTDELEPLGIIGVGNVDRRKPRVLPDTRMNLGHAFCDEDYDVVFLQQTRACDPPLKGYEVGAIVARHVAHVSRGMIVSRKLIMTAT